MNFRVDSPEDYITTVMLWAKEVERRHRTLLVNTANAARNSIMGNGAPDPITGAPGQPVVTGYLRGSWQLIYESPNTALIATNCAYARVIEENSREAYDPRGTLPPEEEVDGGGGNRKRSTVGGHHSVKLTRAGIDRLTEVEALKIIRGERG